MIGKSDASLGLDHVQDLDSPKSPVLGDSISITTHIGPLKAPPDVTGEICSQMATSSREVNIEGPTLPHRISCVMIGSSNAPAHITNVLDRKFSKRLLTGPSTCGYPNFVRCLGCCSGNSSSTCGFFRSRSASCPQIGGCHAAKGYSAPGGPVTAPASASPERASDGSHCAPVNDYQIAMCCCLDRSALARQGGQTWNESLDGLPNEVLLHILSYLEVCDLLATSRTNHHLRDLSLSPILHSLRLRQIRVILPPLLQSPSRPTLTDLIGRRIFMTQTTVVSRKLSRSLVSIRLSRRLAARPSPEALVARGVLPPEWGGVAPALVARKRAVEKERMKDDLRGFVGRWTGKARERGEGVRRWEESRGVGRVWRLKRFWERIAKGDGGGLREA